MTTIISKEVFPQKTVNLAENYIEAELDFSARLMYLNTIDALMCSIYA